MEQIRYNAIKISLRKIKEMIRRGTWEGSLEQEEVVHNLQHNLYPERYTNKVSKMLVEKAEVNSMKKIYKLETIKKRNRKNLEKYWK